MSCSDIYFETDCQLSNKLNVQGAFKGTDITTYRNVQGTDITIIGNVQGTDITIERNVQGKILHINLYCTTIGYHTDRTLHVMRNVQGQTHIKDNFNFVQ